MPGLDGTGPRGMGPMTGGGRGFCSPWGIGAAYHPYGVTPWAEYGFRLGWGFSPFAPSLTREQELDFLNNQAEAMREQLEQIEARIKQLGSNG